MSSQWIRNQWIRNLYRSWFGTSQRPQRNTRYTRVRLESLEDRLAPAASMVSDINQVPVATGINLANMTSFNDELFFAGEDPVHGLELWKSDGTPEGTVLVKDIFAGTQSGSPRQFTAFNGALYFFGNHGVTGLELWKTDGTTEGTGLVKDIRIGRRPGSDSTLVSVGGALYFAANDGVNGQELWISDGTAEGTRMVKDLTPIDVAGGDSLPTGLTGLNGKLLFAAREVNFDYELYITDGTASGTTLVKDIRPGMASYPSNLLNINGTVFFTANDGTNGEELWKTDGTAAGTVLVKDILGGSGSSAPRYLTNVNGVLYFRANNGVNGEELWKSDGTAAGTVLVKDIRSGNGNSTIRNLTSSNGQLFFRAIDGVNGDELWRSDGTSVGTVLVKDINAGSGNSSPQDLFDRNGTLFFRANSTELWKSDGTALGTQLISIIGSASSGHGKLTEINGTLYFRASAGGVGQELWKSDGTTAGTVVVKDVIQENAGSVGGERTDVNGVLFFAANNSTIGEELWKSDGTAAGTVLVKDILGGSGSSLPRNLTNFNGVLYFTAIDDVIGNELWKSDGTAAGTVIVKDIRAGTASSSPQNFTVVNNTLFFTANDGVNGIELWKTDGTTAGTVMVRNIRTGSASSSPTELVNVNGTLFFSADDGTNGRELWKSDGTSAGTVLVRNIRSGSAASTPFGLINVNGTLFFRADDGTRGAELWKSNGTNAGTVLVKDIRPGSSRSSSSDYLAQAVFNGTLYFVANDGTNGIEVWRSDGTAAGTVLVKDIYHGNSTPSEDVPRDLIVANGQVFFVAADGLDLPGHGQELWRIDASAGAVLVKDIMPGDGSSSPNDLYLYNGALVFLAVDPVHGAELWTSDGTPEGTVIFADVIPGSGDGIPVSGSNFGRNAGFTQSAARLFFVAGDMTHGRELWQFTNDLPVITNVPALVEIPELVAYSLQVEAYDPDVPDGAGLRYQLLNAPAGASIDASGNFTWTPSEAQGPGDYSFTIRVRDGLGQVDTPITVRVLEVNLPPTVNGVPVEDTIPELAAYTFTATGADPDLPPNDLIFSLVDAPAGASIDSAGVFTWTPSEAQGPADYRFYVRLSDGTTFVDMPITLHVTEVNQAPVLSGVPAEAVIPEMVAYSFTASGFDADLPANVLTFSLVNGPAGAAIDSAGVFTWTPSELQGPADYSFYVRLSDGATYVDMPITLHVTEVNRPPVLTDVPTEAYIPVFFEYTFTVTAEDPDLPANILVFDLVGAPDGASIDAAGVFTWTPSAEQALGHYSFAVRLSDGIESVSVPITLHVTGGTAAVVGGTLYVIGTEGADQFHINLESGPTYLVHFSLFAGGSLALDASGVDRIVVLLGAGNDQATIAGNVATPALLNGGDGNDQLSAGGGSAILLGGFGDDILIGGTARDLMLGGLDADRLNGTAGDDIFVDGTSDHDGNTDALWALLAEWKREDRSYAERVANLRNGGGLNGAVRLSSETVDHDDSVDVLTGSSGMDWFWANLDDPLLTIDNITGSLNDEIVN
jgi:ELWxxDGT repeat protein